MCILYEDMYIHIHVHTQSIHYKFEKGSSLSILRHINIVNSIYISVYVYITCIYIYITHSLLSISMVEAP
jgi:hypothetical protein